MGNQPKIKKYPVLGHRLPHSLAAPLFGDRQRFGLAIQKDDPDWLALQEGFLFNLYKSSQREGVGRLITDAGYDILKRFPMSGYAVMEIGPGILPHADCWQGQPASYTIVDNDAQYLHESEMILERMQIPVQAHLTNSHLLPVADQQYDLVLSFYNLEHLHPLSDYLKEIWRVLKPGGMLVGAIPTEGGLAWGMGRFLTTRRYTLKNSSINPDKIICWAHPNFADYILDQLQHFFKMQEVHFWPFLVPLIDANTTISFICKKAE